LNVALTRARFARFIVGNAKFFLNHNEQSAVKEFISFMAANGLTQPVVVGGAPPKPTPSQALQTSASRPRRENGEKASKTAPEPTPLPEEVGKVSMQHVVAIKAASEYFQQNDFTDNN
jgi:hypothetical protein